jgi:membrane-associated phospholipid phosphatase
VSTHARPRLHYAKVLALAYAVWFLSFEAVGRYAATLPTTDLTSAWDRALPLIPAFIWPYELCYALPFFSLVVIRDWRRFNVALLAILLASVTAFVVYLLVPVAFPRPSLGTSLSERLIALEYAADFSPGANKLPSMHVALSWIMGAAMYRQRGRVVDGVVLVMVVAITASTVFVKQHLLLDVAAGIVWGLVAFRLANWLLVRLSQSGHVHRV